MMTNFCNCFVCLVATVMVFHSTAYGYVDDPSAVVLQGTGWRSGQAEYRSFFECDSNEVMIGRKHYHDENGQTWYMCGKVFNDGHQFEVSSHSWSDWGKESDFTYVCPAGNVMTGREHKDDENGQTRYRCATVQHNGLSITYKSHLWSEDIEESNSQFICPTNQVMTARYHYDDENGKTAYQCSTFNPAYLKTYLQNQYVGESRGCVWRLPPIKQQRLCPPFVIYYDQTLRHSLLLSVKENRIFNSQDLSFDTSSAGDSHGGKKAAIFTMGVFGDVYASNVHPLFLFHHSTFFAGNPVAAAGEIIAQNGIISYMTSCSGHYRPSDNITKQAIHALNKQGYSRAIKFTSCALLHFDYMILKSGDKIPPAELRFTNLYSALVGPGETVVCEEKQRDFCLNPISLNVPRFTTIKLCFHNKKCNLYTEGNHQLSDGVVKYAEFKISAN